VVQFATEQLRDGKDPSPRLFKLASLASAPCDDCACMINRHAADVLGLGDVASKMPSWRAVIVDCFRHGVNVVVRAKPCSAFCMDCAIVRRRLVLT